LPTEKNDYNKTHMKQPTTIEPTETNIIQKTLSTHYAFSFFILVFTIKAFLLFNLHRVNPAASLQSVIPFMFGGDALACLLIFIIFDIPWWVSTKINKTAGTIIKGFIIAVYYVVVLYSLLMLNFYLLFGSFLNAGLLTLADNIGSFSGGIFSEFGPLAFSLIAISFFYALITEFSRKGMAKISKGILTYLFLVLLFLYMLFSSGFIKTEARGINLYSLENNALIQFFSSLIMEKKQAGITEESQAEVAAEETSDKKTEKRNIYGSGLSSSIIDEGMPAEILKVNNVENKKMNVIFYKFESTNRDYLGLFTKRREKYTPNIMKLSKNAAILSNHYAQEPASLKALYTSLSGRYSYKTRDWNEFISLSNKDSTLPEILNKNGYRTAFFSSGNNSIYNLQFFIQNRFERKKDARNTENSYGYEDFGICLDDRILVKEFDKYLGWQTNKKGDEKKPFFAYFNPVFPHHPYMIPSEEFRLNDKDTDYYNYLNALYFADHVVGQLYDLLKKYKIQDNTLFVIFADHGEAFFQHYANYLHSIYLYNENIQTFAMIINPGLFDEPVYYKDITRHIDLTPTVLDLLGIESDAVKSMQGVSLLKPHEKQLAMFYTSYNDYYMGLADGKWKYIINKKYNAPELYNIEEDKREKNNLAEKYPDIVEKFNDRLLKLDENI